MEWFEGVRLALQQIRSQKLKSFFSVLGVIIGVMFLITVVSVVEGMDRYVREDLGSEIFGINTVTVDRVGTVVGNLTDEQRRALFRRPQLTTADSDRLRETLATAGVVSAQVDSRASVSSFGGLEVENVEIIAADAPIFDIRGWVVEEGRAFSPQEAERGTPVVVLGQDVVEALFPDGGALGGRVKIDGIPFRVVGILEKMGSVLGQSRDAKAIAPLASPLGRIASPRGYLDEIIVQAPTPELVMEARNEVEGIMRVQRRLRPGEDNNFAVETQEQSLSFWDRISTILYVAFPTLVAISLIVGGIVIMNIMLVSVMERTREIGVRKAIGARQRDILAQVLIESSTLSLFGAGLGVAIGVGLSWLVRAVTPLPAAVAVKWVVVAVVLGVATGVIAGVYPARRAARLDPVDALRYE
ncbi:MAG: ABC transporter permease [Gemmatimonadota bacterium]